MEKDQLATHILWKHSFLVFTPSLKARVLVLVCFATVEPNLDLNLDHDRLALKLYRRNLLIDLYRNFKPNLIYERLDCILS